MRQLAGVMCVLLTLWAGAAFAAPAQQGAPIITSIRYAVAEPRMRIVVDADAPLTADAFLLSSPNHRLVVDLPTVQFGLPATEIGGGQRAVTGEGSVERVRFAQFARDTSRLVFDLSQAVCLRQAFTMPPAPDQLTHRLVVDLEACGPEEFAKNAGFRKTRIEATRLVERTGEIVVVIDPGHGGKDPGAIAASGLREKDVNLAVARMLRDHLEKSRRYKVVLTRDEDEYLDLYRRVAIAREAGADLFISLHADSVRRSTSIRGASVYTLSERARNRARTEILAEGNFLYELDLESQPAEVGNILFDMAQRDTGNRSGVFANIALRQLSRVTPILRNGQRDAGFVVLLAPDVPATLIELGFLSSPADAKLLATKGHRDKLARAISRAVDEYFEQDAASVGFRTARLELATAR